MQIDLTPIICAIITLLASVLTANVIPWIKNRTTSEQQEHLKFWLSVAVQSAEMLYKGTGRGAEKLEYVEKFISDKGFNLNSEELRAVIESAVLEIKETANPVVVLQAAPTNATTRSGVSTLPFNVF